MAEFRRTAEAVWHGDLRGGNGKINSSSGVIKDQPYFFRTRFENEPGTNPEELIAAAHAACFSMAFANTIAKEGLQPEEVFTRATCVLSPKPEGGFHITEMHLETTGRVPGIDQARFEEIAKKAEAGCPVSNLLRPGLAIHLKATLI